MEKNDLIVRGLGLYRKICLVVILIGGGIITAYSQDVSMVNKWLSPVLRGGQTTLNVSIFGGDQDGKTKSVKVSWDGFMAGEQEFTLDKQGEGNVVFEHYGTLCLKICVEGIERAIDVIVNPGEEVEVSLDVRGENVNIKGDYAELNCYLFYRKSERADVVDVEKIKGMTGGEYVAYCKTLYDDRLHELNKEKDIIGAGILRYLHLEALLDCLKNIHSGYYNFKVAYRDEQGKNGPRVSSDDLKVLGPDIVDAGYDLMLFPESRILPLLRCLKDERQLSACLGVDSGYLFDLYRTRASTRILSENLPLDNQCLEQLKQVSSGIADWFIRLNEKVEREWQAHIGKKGYEIGKVPVVPKEQVLDSILATYQGEVVFIDFWYVYCRSCLKAMEEMEEVKQEYLKKGVKFLFITGEKASPKVRWLKMIPDMKGIHYRVTDETYRYLIDKQFEMKGLPYYLVVDRQGQIKYRYNGFMGCEKMREILDEELSK